MTKKHFIALADHLIREREHGPLSRLSENDFQAVVNCMAEFCRSQNPRFSFAIFEDYIKGICGPSGGRLR